MVSKLPLIGGGNIYDKYFINIWIGFIQYEENKKIKYLFLQMQEQEIPEEIPEKKETKQTVSKKILDELGINIEKIENCEIERDFFWTSPNTKTFKNTLRN